ncbi:hypothetical protein JW964_23880 [candidate division KSB1 bacterium]|nr:hypothetical protein [candidate division KSB1 bacterium]
MITIFFKKINFFIFAIGLTFNLLIARENPIRSVEMVIEQEKLVAIGHFSGLMTVEMRETLASGMSTSLNFQLKLINRQTQQVKQSLYTIFLRYNVWEKNYRLWSSFQDINFKTAENFEHFLNDSLKFQIISIKNLSANDNFTFILYYSPQKISDNQKNKLNEWLKNEGEMNKAKPGQESESVFSINVSSLISIFLTKKNENSIHLFQTAPFTLQALKKHENTTW